MFDVKEKAGIRRDIKIGGEVFHVSLEHHDRGLALAIEKNWHDYLIPSVSHGCRVEVIPYSHGRLFPWSSSESDAFREYFSRVHRRFPSVGQVEKAVDSSLKILHRFETHEKHMGYIRSCLDQSDTLVYARVGVDLFFYDTRSDRAYFFLKARMKRSVMFVGFVNGIMLLLSHRLIQNHGLLLHGAAVRKEDQTVLFLGLSGAGKSTITGLCKPDICFSDDGAVLRVEGDRIYVYGSPFRQVAGTGEYGNSLKDEIKKIFLLEQGPRNEVLPIRKSELMHIILLHLIHFYKYLNEDTARMGFDVVKEIIERAPIYRLQFNNQRSIWNDIR